MNNDTNYWIEMSNFPESYSLLFREEERLLDKYIGDHANVLDLGCGDGRSLKQLSQKTKNLVGVDHDKKIVKKANRDLPNIKIIYSEGTSLPFDDGYFDNVLCLGTFTNLGDERIKVLSEMKRVLDRNGSIIITAYSEDALEDRLKLYGSSNVEIEEIKPNGTVLFRDSVDSISEQFSRSELETIISKAGLKIMELNKAGIVYSGVLGK
ncbi:class I SAM-dependent methyltransferase [archaeon]|jgi:ubiquinone/menaquinone biosynthesis C-methylase UbiE|nr:class I SAM-dependent methyltransferase [archaeon]